MAGIFISYRREDSGSYAGRLYDALVEHFDRNDVFLDIDTLRPGEDFREMIERTCSSCEILLAIIGPRWATVKDGNGSLRLGNERDLVRTEIVTALLKGLRVIPILVGGAAMPDEEALPADIRQIAYRHAFDVDDKRFHHDALLLIDAIKKIRGTTVKAPGRVPSVENKPSLFPLYGIILGKTRLEEIATLGKVGEARFDSGDVYQRWCEVEGVKFIFDEQTGIVGHFSLYKRAEWPGPWQKVGFRANNSYDGFLFALEKLGYTIKINEPPRLRKWEGHKSFSAEVSGRMIDPYHVINLDFDYSTGVSSSDPGTLYRLWASIDG